MKAVIYARYSSDNQREESIESQIRECTAFAEKNGMTILKHYIDRAYSAKTDDRPQFQQMIKDSDKHLFDRNASQGLSEIEGKEFGYGLYWCTDAGADGFRFFCCLRMLATLDPKSL